MRFRSLALLSGGIALAACNYSGQTAPPVPDLPEATAGRPRPTDPAPPDRTLGISVNDSVWTVRCTPARPPLCPDRCELVVVSSVQNPSSDILHLDACRFRLERWEEGNRGRDLVPVCPAILRTKPILPGETVADTVRLTHHAGPNIHSDFALHNVSGIYRLVRPVHWRFYPPGQPNHLGDLLPLEPAVSRPFRVAIP